MSKPTLIQSNFVIEGKKKSHPVVIFENQIYWWKNCNKDLSEKFYCHLRNQHKSTATKLNFRGQTFTMMMMILQVSIMCARQ